MDLKDKLKQLGFKSHQIDVITSTCDTNEVPVNSESEKLSSDKYELLKTQCLEDARNHKYYFYNTYKGEPPVTDLSFQELKDLVLGELKDEPRFYWHFGSDDLERIQRETGLILPEGYEDKNLYQLVKDDDLDPFDKDLMILSIQWDMIRAGLEGVHYGTMEYYEPSHLEELD